MRLVLMCVSAILALAALGFARDATGTAAQHPRLVLKRAAPLIVGGTHFRARERVTVVLDQPAGGTRRRTRAGRHGAFRKVFPGVAVDRCRGFRVSAKGSAGSRATLVRRALPECAPS